MQLRPLKLRVRNNDVPASAIRTCADSTLQFYMATSEQNPYQAPREMGGPAAKDVTVRPPPRILTRLLWSGVGLFFVGFFLAFLPIRSVVFVALVLLLIIGGCLLVIGSCLVRLVLAISRRF